MSPSCLLHHSVVTVVTVVTIVVTVVTIVVTVVTIVVTSQHWSIDYVAANSYWGLKRLPLTLIGV